jgi:hypothetical protein
LRFLRVRFEEAAKMVQQRDKAYADLLLGLVTDKPAARILAMMGAGHERAVNRFLREKGVDFKQFTQPSRLPSSFRSVALERTENGEALSRFDWLRCLAEFWQRPAFVPLGERGALLMYFWIARSTEAELSQYISSIYA